MFEIVIQIKDGDEYRTLINGPYKCQDAADLLPEFVRNVNGLEFDFTCPLCKNHFRFGEKRKCQKK